MKASLAFLALVLPAVLPLRAIDSLPPGPVIGIGAELRSSSHQPVVGEVVPNSPADKGGIKPGDLFVRIDNQSVAGESLVEIASRLRGAVGSPVSVTIQRNGRERTFDLHRQIIVLASSR